MPENEKLQSVIQKISLTEATFEGASEEARTIKPCFVNFFFGKNGSGKTTIGRQIRDDVGIEYTKGMPRNSYEVLVYNQDFVDDYFCTYDRLKGVFRISKDGKNVEKNIADYERQMKDAQSVIDNIAADIDNNRAALSEADTIFQANCWRNSKDLRDPYKSLLKGALKAAPFSKKVLETTPAECDPTELAELYKTAYVTELEYYPSFDTYKDGALDIGVIPACSLLGEPIESRSDTQFARFVKAIGATDWVKIGHDTFHNTPGRKCPYCQQTMPTDFEEKLADIFDEQYLQDLQTIRKFRDRYKDYMGELWRIFNSNTKKKLFPGLDMARYKAQLDAFSNKLQRNLQIIDSKIEKPATAIEIEDVTSDLMDLNHTVKQFNTAINKNNADFNARKDNQDRFLPMLWGLIAYRLQGEVESYRTKIEKIDREYKLLNDKKKAHEIIVQNLLEKIKELTTSATSIQPVIDQINTLLDESGFEGFKIVKSDKIENGYKVVRRDKSTVIKLSEGERNFISFLYFYHMVKGTMEPDGVVRDKIVVVDDPISSMDSNSIFLVSALIREMIEICNNNAEYRNQQIAGDYIKQFFVMTHNAYFHKVITYNQVNRYKSVNFYLVDKLDNISSVTLCQEYSKTSAGDLVNINPVKNSYAALWSEYRDLKTALPLLNVMHRILDYYFLDMCGYDGLNIRQRILINSRDKFIVKNPDGTEDRTKLQLASHLLSFIAAGISDDVHFVTTSQDPDKLRDVFRIIFEAMEQIQHHDMMIERAR